VELAPAGRGNVERSSGAWPRTQGLYELCRWRGSRAHPTPVATGRAHRHTPHGARSDAPMLPMQACRAAQGRVRAESESRVPRNPQPNEREPGAWEVVIRTLLLMLFSFL